MIFRVPPLTRRDTAALQQLDTLRAELRFAVREPRRWVGGLRQLYFAKAVQASNTIEGYDASLNDVLHVVGDEPPTDAETETVHALQGYRDAMTYVLQIAEERTLAIDPSLLRSLHFMMLKHDLSTRPGRWRRGAIFIATDPDQRVVYEGPDVDLVDDLMTELVDSLDSADGHSVVRAAMAHLNLVMIHPFADGNGRMARCLQTLVLSHDRVLGPTFCSIEEYLGEHTAAYYAVLGEVGRGSWNPDNSALPWVRFCIEAHLDQALTLKWRLKASETLWMQCEQLVTRHGLPIRSVGPLSDAAQGRRLRNAGYRLIVSNAEGVDISDQSAGLDLRRLVAAGLLETRGETRGRHYVASPVLRGVWREVQDTQPRPRSTALFGDCG